MINVFTHAHQSVICVVVIDIAVTQKVVEKWGIFMIIHMWDRYQCLWCNNFVIVEKHFTVAHFAAVSLQCLVKCDVLL